MDGMAWDTDPAVLGPDAVRLLERSGNALLDSLFGPVARPLGPNDLALWHVMCGAAPPQSAEQTALLAFARALQVVLEGQARSAKEVLAPHLSEIEALHRRTSDQAREAEAVLRQRRQQLASQHAAMTSVLQGAEDSQLFPAHVLNCELAVRELHAARALPQRPPDEWPSSLKDLLAVQMAKLGIGPHDGERFRRLAAALTSGFTRGWVNRLNDARQAFATARQDHVNTVIAGSRNEVEAAEQQLVRLRQAIIRIDEDLRACRDTLLALESASESIRPVLRPAAFTTWSASLDALALLALKAGRLPQFHMRLACAQRSIGRLVHFTHIENLDTIRRHGILPVPELEQRGIKPRVNDPERFDFRLDAVSMSIEFPNYQLFFRFRNQQGTSERDWCIIDVCPSVLWTSECVFSAENAATASEARREDDLRRGVDGFSRLFDDSGGTRHNVSRDQLGLPPSFPTNPQAEVQVLRGIRPDKIRAIYTVDTLRDLFRPRLDWSVWKAARERRLATPVEPPTLARPLSTGIEDDIPF
ncbi:MAG: DUF4433 domain-containing protein [Leptolyngbya sp. PLA1]|nr:DUF4433 domain-containing protein [Leptolyngbya sp. PLA1]